MVTTAMLSNMQRNIPNIPFHDGVAMKPTFPSGAAPAPSTSASEQAKAVKRTRKTHSKVRTGCLTCKIRRKKCDETKPACERCTSTGRKCDGYPSLAETTQSSSDEKSVTTASSSSVSRVVNNSGPVPRDYLSQRSGLGEVKNIVASDIPAPIRLLPRGQSPGDTEPLSFMPSKREPNTFASASLLDSQDRNVATLDNEFDEFADEELEDFILSYVKPIDSSKSVSSVDTLLSERSSFMFTPPSSAPSVDGVQPTSTAALFDRLPVPRSPRSYGGPVSDIERHCFTYFRYQTGPSFSSYFESSIWRAYAVSAALAHPVVLTCAAACGAAHRRFSYGISREAFEYCAHADRLHKKALQGLEKLKREVKEKPSSMEMYDTDAIMTGELLLGLYHGFQSEFQQTVAKINSSVRHLLARPMTLVHSESRYCTVESQPHIFRELFDRLHCRALELFGSHAKILVTAGQGRALPTIPTMFADLEQARDFLFTEVDWIVQIPTSAWQDTGKRTELQDLHVRRLLNWSVAYANTVQTMERTSREKRACTLLKLMRSVTYMLLYLTLFVDELDVEIEDDSAQDSGFAYISRKLWETVEQREVLHTRLEILKICIEGILDDNGIFSYDEHSVSFDSAISPTGNPTTSKQAAPEKSGKTKHLVKRFMQKNENNQSLWSAMGVYSICESISAVEEHAVIESVRDLLPEPESIDPKWVDLTCLMESRRILLRYARPCGLGLTWTQEWWAF